MAAAKSLSLAGLPAWSLIAPLMGLALAIAGVSGSGVLVAAAIAALMVTVLAAVHHAETALGQLELYGLQGIPQVVGAAVAAVRDVVNGAVGFDVV